MLKISKLTDYGTLVMAHLALKPETIHSATDVASATHVALPTVSKILKMLSVKELVVSTRGAKGGYRLAREPEAISIADVLCAMEGPVALTTCATGSGECEQESVCTMASHWQLINTVVSDALSGLTLADLVQHSANKGGLRVSMVPLGETARNH
ncbi:MAG: SUF system Fe-S cluster assembly regulator [Gammaproteobacteria bacterium]